MRWTIATLAGILIPCIAQAQELGPTYVAVSGGWSGAGTLRASGTDVYLGPFAVREDLKSGWMASGLVGARVGKSPVSLEAEALYVRNHVSSPDLDAAFGTPLNIRSTGTALLANLKLSAPQAYDVAGVQLRPYLAGGVGYGRNAVTILGDDYSGDGVTWQGKAGLEFASSGPLGWDIGYRYAELPGFHTNKLGLDAHMKTHFSAVTLGVRYTFGAH